MPESKTHRDIKLAVADSLKQFGYRTQVERYFEGGRWDICATNDKGEEIEVEIQKTHLPDRFIVKIPRYEFNTEPLITKIAEVTTSAAVVVNDDSSSIKKIVEFAAVVSAYTGVPAHDTQQLTEGLRRLKQQKEKEQRRLLLVRELGEEPQEYDLFSGMLLIKVQYEDCIRGLAKLEQWQNSRKSY